MMTATTTTTTTTTFHFSHVFFLFPTEGFPWTPRRGTGETIVLRLEVWLKKIIGLVIFWVGSIRWFQFLYLVKLAGNHQFHPLNLGNG